MKKTIFSIFVCLTFVIFLSCIYQIFSTQEIKSQPPANAAENNRSKQLLTIDAINNFYDNSGFLLARNFADSEDKKNNIQAFIAPHDQTAAKYLAAIAKSATGREIKKIIIIGPNHENLGAANLATGKAKWQTPFGFVETDDALANKFLADFNIKDQPLIFQNEHSIGGIVFFTKYYFPAATILPIILNSYTDIREANKLSEWLKKNYDDNTLIIYSIDFSHYLPKEEAVKKDELTQAMIINNDLEKIFKLNNDYVDSPATLAAALILAKAKGWPTNFIYHSNSFDLTALKNYQTTSHFVITFTQ